MVLLIDGNLRAAFMVFLQAGAGIVADSNPVSEYNEWCNKVRALAKVLVQEENL